MDLRSTESTRRNTLHLRFVSRKRAQGSSVTRMIRTMSHKTERLEMHNHVNSVPEEVSSRDSKGSSDPFIPAECPIRRQGRRTKAPDGQGNHD